VRHGTHEWTVDDAYDREPDLPAAPTIRQLMDHEPTWQQIVAAAVSSGVSAGEAAVAARLERYLDAQATELVDAVTGGSFHQGADAFRAALPSDFRS